MATQLLSAAEAGPWSEDKVATSRAGHQPALALQFRRGPSGAANAARGRPCEQADNARAQNKTGNWGHLICRSEIPEIPPYYFLNTHALVSQSIVPLTKEIDAPLFALVPPKYRGKPAVFISHTWNSLLFGAESNGSARWTQFTTEEDEFVWIDFACYNQNRVDNSKISEDM